MLNRQSSVYINVTLLNDIKLQPQSFLLFNLLFNSAPDAVYTIGTLYTVNNQALTLSYTLKATDTKAYTTRQSFLVINDQGEIVGDLYLLSIGIVYYQDRLKPLLSINGNLAKINLLIKKTLTKHENNIADDPIMLEYRWLKKRVEIAAINELPYYYIFILFYNTRLEEARQWQREEVTLSTYKPIPHYLHCFLHSTQSVHFFLNYKKYFFQGRVINFDRAMIRRQRSKPPVDCFDILASDAIGSGQTSGIYPVAALYVENGHKSALKHPYVYKISNRYKLGEEFEATRDIAHLQRARNYHPELFSLPYFGQCFFDFVQNNIKKRCGVYYIHTILKYTARIYFALAEQFKDKVHGDVKANNICIDSTGKLWLIDYRRENNLTYHYAAPELYIKKKKQSPASDVYSAARMICEFWGDPHPVWRFITEKPDLIVAEIAKKKSSALLEPLFHQMRHAYSAVAFPRDLLHAYQRILRECHFRDPARRPTALNAANEFEAVFQAYDAYFKKLDKKKFLKIQPMEYLRRHQSV